jgi:hypothetical protein
MKRAPLVLTTLAVVTLGMTERSFNAAASRRLELTAGDGRTVWAVPIEPGDTFDLAFTHSSERCRWVHHYVVSPRASITQRASTFPCFGPGMPTASTDGSAVRRTSKGFETAAPLVLGHVEMMNWRAADITLRVGGDVFHVGDRLSDYERFTLRLR